jgi:hypothetical protein
MVAKRDFGRKRVLATAKLTQRALRSASLCQGRKFTVAAQVTAHHPRQILKIRVPAKAGVVSRPLQMMREPESGFHAIFIFSNTVLIPF